jgi:hypothetical protein
MIERPENTARQPDYLAYLLRLWRMEGSADAWRGSVESPQTGERLGFGSLDELFDFLREQTGKMPKTEQVSESSHPPDR